MEGREEEGEDERTEEIVQFFLTCRQSSGQQINQSSTD